MITLRWLALVLCLAAAVPSNERPHRPFAVPPDQQPHQALDGIHKKLGQQPPRLLVIHRQTLQVEAQVEAHGGPSTTPLVLVGIMSGSEARRAIARCTWLRVGGNVSSVRVLFVVGRPGTHSVVSGDILYVDVREKQRMWNAGAPRPRSNGSEPEVVTGTFTTYLKQNEFLRYAATQKEKFVVRADDDVYISLPMLQAYGALLSELGSNVYAGVFEWYSWKLKGLHSTGFGFSCKAANSRARAPWRNCSQVLSNASWDQHHCVGPFAFAKGPFLLLSTEAARRVVASATFARDLARAKLLASGTEFRVKGRIDDDVHLAFWLSSLPNLRVVRIRRLSWHEQGKWSGAALSHFLAAHKLPWRLYGEMSAKIDGAWNTAKQAAVHLVCSDEPACSSAISAHASSQGTCIIEVRLKTTSTAPVCDGMNGRPTKCPFNKAEPPTAKNCWKTEANTAIVSGQLVNAFHHRDD
ncbi:hypothetical protein AB1Y20_015320 [Prymnesium parvum]|uniref:Hexosyltransferase n=1 Tax=Prymnesium parvum TaxID=97485 RepID=A0AB34K0G2_PRYPA